MAQKIQRSEAIEAILKLIEGALPGIPGQRHFRKPDIISPYRVELAWNRGWGADATLGFDLADATPLIEVGWSGTHHTPVGAISAAKLHVQVAELAA
jgi:hypothetical protein